MNTNISQNDKDHLVRSDYYVQLWFEKGVLTAAVLQDDYTAWFDLAAGIEGSNLADANIDDVTEAQLIELLSEWYLTEETAALYFNVIETNDREIAARIYPEFIARGFTYIGIQEKHMTTIGNVQRKAHEQFKAWTEGNA